MKFAWLKRFPLAASASVSISVNVTKSELAGVDVRKLAEFKAEQAQRTFAEASNADLIEEALRELQRSDE